MLERCSRRRGVRWWRGLGGGRVGFGVGPAARAAIGGPELVRRLCGVLTLWHTMTDFDLVTAADVQLMQGLAQRVTATRPDLVNSDATFGELAWNWGKGHASDGASWPRRLWFSGRGSGGVELGLSSAPGEAERRVSDGRGGRVLLQLRTMTSGQLVGEVAVHGFVQSSQQLLGFGEADPAHLSELDWVTDEHVRPYLLLDYAHT